MRFAAIADIHGNALALEAVLADIASLGITDVVNLGDHLSGPLAARETADILMSRDITTIRGDQDRQLIEMHRAGKTSRRIDYNALEAPHFDWLAGQPETMHYRGDILLCHGSPLGDDVFWLDRIQPGSGIQAAPIDAIEAEAAGIGASLILCGHTHIPRAVRLRDGRMVVNPGSVGCPGYAVAQPVPHIVQAGTPDARYAIVNRADDRWDVTFRLVPYDNGAMARLAEDNGAPIWAEALTSGWVTGAMA